MSYIFFVVKSIIQIVCDRLLAKRAAWLEGRDESVTLIDGHHLNRALRILISSAEGEDRNEAAIVIDRLKDNLGKMKLWPGDVLLATFGLAQT